MVDDDTAPPWSQFWLAFNRLRKQEAFILLAHHFLAVALGGTARTAFIAKAFGIGAYVVTVFHLFYGTATILSINWMTRTLLRSGWVKPA